MWGYREMTKYKNYKTEAEFVEHQGGDRHRLVGLAIEARDLLEFCNELPYAVNTKDYNSVVETFYENFHWPASACQDIPEAFKFSQLTQKAQKNAARELREYMCACLVIKKQEFTYHIAYITCELKDNAWLYNAEGMRLNRNHDWYEISETIIKRLGRGEYHIEK
jgi:hypothetical protein